MWLRNIAIACAAAGLTFGEAMPSAEGKYIRPQIESVPVDRLVANLNKLADENPKDALVRFNLARLHAMAFALKTDTAEIRKGQEEKGPFFGYEPRHIPFAVQETKDEDKLKEAKVQLAKAIDRYREALKLDPNLLPAQLGYAWCLEQSGKRDEAIAEYRKTIELGWKKEKDLTQADLGWHSIVAESAGYLKPLLDAGKDKDEIAELDRRSCEDGTRVAADHANCGAARSRVDRQRSGGLRSASPLRCGWLWCGQRMVLDHAPGRMAGL